jgi:hypothetical protein
MARPWRQLSATSRLPLPAIATEGTERNGTERKGRSSAFFFFFFFSFFVFFFVFSFSFSFVFFFFFVFFSLDWRLQVPFLGSFFA